MIIGRVVRGGLAEKSNLLREGDELIEANGNDLRGKNVTEVCNILVGNRLQTFNINFGIVCQYQMDMANPTHVNNQS